MGRETFISLITMISSQLYQPFKLKMLSWSISDPAVWLTTWACFLSGANLYNKQSMGIESRSPWLPDPKHHCIGYGLIYISPSQTRPQRLNLRPWRKSAAAFQAPTLQYSLNHGVGIIFYIWSYTIYIYEYVFAAYEFPVARSVWPRLGSFLKHILQQHGLL